MLRLRRFSYKNSANRIISFCEISIWCFADKVNVVVRELPDNPGMSICNAFEDLFVQVCQFYNLDPSQVQWFENWPKWTKEQGGYKREKESWYQVNFELVNNQAINPIWEEIEVVN